MKTRFFLPKTTARNIENELMAQMERYAELGGTLWHIDSHHHVHTDPSVWRILKKIFRNRSVSSVRLGRNMYRGGGLLGHIYKLMLNRSIKRYCEKPQRYFGSMEDYLEFTKDGALPSSGADDEVMVHPVYDDKGRLSDVTGGKFSELVRLH